MTEAEARDWLSARNVPRETIDRLDAFAALVIAENRNQNLIGRPTEAEIWNRHIVDSAQLAWLGHFDGRWGDLGSGPGFPGIVIALVTGAPMTLIETRARRVEFLLKSVDMLGLAGSVAVHGGRAESYAGPPFDTITARAFAALDKCFALSPVLGESSVKWVLPKGRSAVSELEEARKAWQGTFHVEQSVTDRDSAIIVASHVRRKGPR